MSAALTVDGVDVSAVTVRDLTVDVGRDDVDGQPDGTVLTAQLDGWTAAGTVGSPAVLVDEYGQMFGGHVTDLDTRLESGLWRTRLGAVGPLADLGRVVIGDEPWPQESDSRRVARILTLAGTPVTGVPTAVLGPAVLPRDVDRRTALELAQGVAQDALGVLWEQPADPAAPIRYLPARLRAWNPVALTWAEQPPDLTWSDLDPDMTWAQWNSDTFALPGDPGQLTIDAGEVIADVGLSQRIGDLVRTCRVTWGVAPEGGTRPEVRLGAGLPEQARTTELATETGALAVADTVVRARREPAWRMTDVTIHLDRLTPARAAQIRAALAVGLKLTITNLAFDGPAGPTWQGYLEGWQHHLHSAVTVDDDGYPVRVPGHTLTLRTSERALTEPADRWQDIDPALTWQDIPPDLTWAQTADFPGGP